jgi:hypothetical protein
MESNYVFALVPNGDGTWTKASWDTDSHEMMEEPTTVDGDTAFNDFEVETTKGGMADEVQDMYVMKFKAFLQGLAGSGSEKLAAAIAELVNNGATYTEGSVLPIVRSAAEVADLKSKL